MLHEEFLEFRVFAFSLIVSSKNEMTNAYSFSAMTDTIKNNGKVGKVIYFQSKKADVKFLM